MATWYSTLVELLSKYGPFPLGVGVGLFIRGQTFKEVLKYAQQERDSINKEKEQLFQIINAKDERIEKLHDQLYKNITKKVKKK